MNEELKVQALLESLGTNTQKYEARIAELRVEITLLRRELDSLRAQRETVVGDDEPYVIDASQDVVEGDLVQDEE